MPTYLLHAQVAFGKSGFCYSVASSSTLRCAEFLVILRRRRRTDLFPNPQWGMFIHDPDSNLCWFNPVSHDLDEFYLVGVVVGLACYNAATLDVPLPQASLGCENDKVCSLTRKTEQAVYKKLLNEPVTLADLAVFRPALARGLRLLLEYEETEEGGSVEDVFCRTFVGEVEEWGEVREEELMPGGAGRVVTRENREGESARCRLSQARVANTSPPRRVRSTLHFIPPRHVHLLAIFSLLRRLHRSHLGQLTLLVQGRGARAVGPRK